MYQGLYKGFLDANPQLLHLAAHSHHYWPDVAKEGVLASYEDSQKLADRKWEKIIGEVVPRSQELIARILNLSHPGQIAFGSNTHELLVRLLSCFGPGEKLRVLTTDSEFHSAKRQFMRLEELPHVEVERIDANQENFEATFLGRVQEQKHDFIFLSQVFFSTGKSLAMEDIKSFVRAKRPDAIFCLDGYHGFCAIPTDLKEVENDIFYLAGGYKYAQAGEGMCFMTIPKGCRLRPIDTGWFAHFASLEANSERVDYAEDGWRFAGSTRDFTAHYRFNSVWEHFFSIGLTAEKIHAYIQARQEEFLSENPWLAGFSNTRLESQGHFLSLDAGSAENARFLHEELNKKNILTDYRANHLRFGFGLYLSSEDVKKALHSIKTINFNIIS